ncbi:MAG: DUF202 domain-containing protein [Syntrophorhabdales bacterium]
MDKNGDIMILLAEEQTFLSRERTMHSYMQTGLAFSSVGLLIMKYLGVSSISVPVCFSS